MGRAETKIIELTDQDLVAMFGGEPNTVRLEQGEVLFKNGDPSACMYVVRNGILTIRSGRVVYEDVGPGGIIGEMGIVQTGAPRTAMVYARAQSELVQIDEQRFLALVEETPSFALYVMRVLARRLHRMDVRYEANRDDPADPNILI